jgi:hypothetical protein
MLGTTPQILELLAGLVFLFVAVVGGGITAKEVTLPTVPIWGRVSAAVIGLALVGLGLLVPVLTLPTGASPDSAHSCRHPRNLPNVSDARTEDSARALLTQQGFGSVTTRAAFVAGAPKGVVVDQSPAPDSVVCPRDPVVLKVTR